MHLENVDSMNQMKSVLEGGWRKDAFVQRFIGRVGAASVWATGMCARYVVKCTHMGTQVRTVRTQRQRPEHKLHSFPCCIAFHALVHTPLPMSPASRQAVFRVAGKLGGFICAFERFGLESLQLRLLFGPPRRGAAATRRSPCASEPTAVR